MKELLMGNEAVALGALCAGVQVVTGYPGTPSTETLETIAKRNPGSVYVEWSVNEKAALEVAAGAAYAGANCLVTMKQVGLNVASDPLMCVNYIGVVGALVVYVADDPGPISSQTEQDTRAFARYARIPVIDCATPEEAFAFVQYAFSLSHGRGTPVILRSTTRVCHACAAIDVPEISDVPPAPGFQKDSRFVIFPRLSYESKLRLCRQEKELTDAFDDFSGNALTMGGEIGILCGGVSSQYVLDAIKGNTKRFTVLQIATPYPFPEKLAARFIERVRLVVAFEELDPVLEDALLYLCGKECLHVRVLGKRSGDVPAAGELSAVAVARVLERTTGLPSRYHFSENAFAPKPPMRPPMLCAGCPHRASFYAVKRAMAGKKAIFCGDIGCYTLGNAAPLNMVDTCLCMGAGITVAQGLYHTDGEAVQFAFVGDSTFFASGLTGVVNALYNQAQLVLVVLDNSTTAMTGHQPHPGIGKTMMHTLSAPVSIENALRGLGVHSVRTLNPFDLSASVEGVRAAANERGVRAVVFRAPCVALVKPEKAYRVATRHCVGCGKCVNDIGCPALQMSGKRAAIDESLCAGCGLCAAICPKGAIKIVGKGAR